MYIIAAKDDSRVPLHGLLKYAKRLRERQLNPENTVVVDVQDIGHLGGNSIDTEAKMWGFLNRELPNPGIIE